MSFTSATARSLFTTTPSISYAPWVTEHMDNLKALVDHVLGDDKKKDDHHCPRSCGWDYSWYGPWWRWMPSYSPVTIYNGGKPKDEDEDHTGLAVIATVAFFVLTFFCGQSFTAYRSYTSQIKEHNTFNAEFDAAATRPSPAKPLGTLKQINTKAQELLENKQHDATVNLALFVGGLMTALFIAIGSYYKIPTMRRYGCYTAFPLGFIALLRLGMKINDKTDIKIAQTLKKHLKNY